MALKIVTGGTTGAADGTLVDSGNPIVFTALDTPVDAHIRADDDTYANPAQFVAATTAGPAVGKGDIQISIDGGSTWKSWSDNPYSLVTGVGLSSVDLGDLNFPIKLRQHAASPPGDTSGSFDTDGTLATATALADVTGFTVTPGNAQNAVSWGAVTNRTRYQVDRATNSGFTTGVTLGVYTGTGTSFTDTGLTNGTTYYYRIKAVGTYRYKDSASFATGNGTPVAVVTGFAVTSISGTTVNLGWTALPGAHHYKVERATDSGFTTGLTTVSDSVTGTTLADTGLTVNATYYYRITAHDASHGALSAAATGPYAAVQLLVLAAGTRGMRGLSSSFATARSGGGTNSVENTDSTDPTGEVATNQEFGGQFYLDRTYIGFTTSGGVIPSAATIDEAWLRLTATQHATVAGGGWAICKGTYASHPPAASDFANVTLSDLGGPTSRAALNTPTDYAITSPNSNIEKNGTAKLVVLERGRDFANTAPASGTWYGSNVGGKGHSTTDRRPQLKVSFRG